MILQNEEDARSKLVKVVELLIHDIESQGAIGRVYYREIRHLSPEDAAEIRRKQAEFRDNIVAIIKEGMENKECRQGLESKKGSVSFLRFSNWSYQWFNPSGDLSVQKLADMYTDFILNGIDASKK